MNNAPEDHSFPAEGLRFDCTRCQRCCRLEPGLVLLSHQDLDRLADFLDLSREAVRDRYCRTVQTGGVGRLTLQEHDNYDCVFWGAGGCTVYAARPLQCRSFPFWPSQVADEESWQAAARECPGIGLGPLRGALEIAYWLKRRAAEPLIDATR